MYLHFLQRADICIQKKGKISHFLKVQFERIQNEFNSNPKTLFRNVRHGSHIRRRNESVNDRTITYVHNAQNSRLLINSIFNYIQNFRAQRMNETINNHTDSNERFFFNRKPQIATKNTKSTITFEHAISFSLINNYL